MKAIRMSNSSDVAFVDDDLWVDLRRYTWFSKKAAFGWYAATSQRVCCKVITILMHRLIMTPEDHEDVHHKDTNTFNNQRDNLEKLDRTEHAKLSASKRWL